MNNFRKIAFRENLLERLSDSGKNRAAGGFTARFEPIGSLTGGAVGEQHRKTIDDGKMSPAGHAGDIRTGQLELAVADRADQPAEVSLGETGRLAG